MKELRERKYLALLTVLIVAAVLEPLAADWSERSRIFAGVIVAVVALGVLLAVFEQRWERWSALFLVTPMLASNITHQVLSGWAQVAAIVYHVFGVVFFGFAVAMILKRIFQGEATRADPVIGALCGYLLAVVAWANAYALVYLLQPGSFHVADALAWRLGDWNLQRFFFRYFSVTTLTSLGYSDITPLGSLALSLSWLEVIFGQFYIAVVVAQLVGLRLAQSMKQM
ncbi:MAG TPA: ion channel [Candidatus Binatia bacterium]|nr:ion channel [Candidatus Binatia bacterium]